MSKIVLIDYGMGNLNSVKRKLDRLKTDSLVIIDRLNAIGFIIIFPVKNVLAANGTVKSSKKYDVLILESSIEVGTTDKMSEILKDGGFTLGQDFGLSFCPERIDPSNKEWGLENIPRVIFCSDDSSF